MRTAFRSSLTTLGVLCVIAGSADLATSETSPGEGREKARLAPARASMMTRAGAARISEESRGVLREPAVEAAPRTSATSSVSEQAVQDSSPSPPAGYSLVSYHGEMPRERLQGEVAAGGQRPLMGSRLARDGGLDREAVRPRRRSRTRLVLRLDQARRGRHRP